MAGPSCLLRNRRGMLSIVAPTTSCPPSILEGWMHWFSPCQNTCCTHTRISSRREFYLCSRSSCTLFLGGSSCAFPFPVLASFPTMMPPSLKVSTHLLSWNLARSANSVIKAPLISDANRRSSGSLTLSYLKQNKANSAKNADNC